MLLSRLGLRGGEVAALELDDLDWRTGEVVIRGKGSRIDRLPLPGDIGQALGSLALERQCDEIVIGRDGRLSGPELAHALADGIAASDVAFARAGDLRYVGQGYELRVPFPSGTLDSTAMARFSRPGSTR